MGSSQKTAVQRSRIPTLNSEPRKASVHLVMHYSTVSKLLATQDSRPYLLSDPLFR